MLLDKTMKKLTTLLSVSFITLVLTACGGGSSSDSSASSQPTTTTGEVQLSWTAPTTRTDGTYLPLTELDGYRIYYGTSADNLTVLIDLNEDDITEYTVDTLPTGNYYFAISAYDSDGVESGYSNVINKDV
jgi:ABC-type glycerol-3-phosphate transport system substrate-binding protein